MVENTENTDFELTNKNVDDWEQAEFWEKDPMQSEDALCDIILWVDWENKTVNVETMMRTNSTPGELYHGLASSFDLPVDTDFTRFVKFYNDHIRPKLQEIGATYESNWNGSNWIGSLDREQEEELSEYIRTNVPEHDMCAYFSLRDLYNVGGSHSIEEDLRAEDIDLLTADLNNDGVLSLAVETVTYGDGTDYKLVEVDVEDELREIQKELQEESEEEE